jgi:hypothetical protein
MFTHEQLHQLIKEKAKKHGLNYPDLNIMEAKQIRQILVAFKDILGENPEIEIFEKAIKGNEVKISSPAYLDTEWVKVFKIHNEGLEIIKKMTPKSQAEVLCQKWLDGLEPLIETNPEQVLNELLEILKTI